MIIANEGGWKFYEHFDLYEHGGNWIILRYVRFRYIIQFQLEIEIEIIFSKISHVVNFPISILQGFTKEHAFANDYMHGSRCMLHVISIHIYI